MNDALEASLTNSNSVNELKIHQSVMGIRMTEEIRKLGKFFLYRHNPLIIALGGQHHNFNIRDKLLLLNQCANMGASTVLIGGKLALYVLKAL